MRISNSDWKQTVSIAAALLLAVMSIAGCPTADEDTANQVSQTASNSAAAATDTVKQTADKLPVVELTHAVLTVSGMTCTSCEEAIKREVGKLNGVANVTAAFADGHVEVDYDAALVDKDAIVIEIEKMQYVVEEFQVGEATAATAGDAPAEEQEQSAGTIQRKRRKLRAIPPALPRRAAAQSWLAKTPPWPVKTAQSATVNATVIAIAVAKAAAVAAKPRKPAMTVAEAARAVPRKPPASAHPRMYRLGCSALHSRLRT